MNGTLPSCFIIVVYFIYNYFDYFLCKAEMWFQSLRGSRSSHRSASVRKVSKPSRHEDISLVLRSLARPVIDTPIILSIPPLPLDGGAKDALQDGSRGRGFSNRTMTGSASSDSHSTPSLLLADPSGHDKHEVTQKPCGSTLRTESPHPLICPTPLSAPVATQVANDNGLPDDYEKVSFTRHICCIDYQVIMGY